MSMSSFGFGSSDPFSDLLNRFFGMSPASSPPAVQRVPIGRLLTESSQELLNLAARRALEDGYEEAGQLTEKVRRQPYSVVLFDEVEKAHPDVFNTLLQILDDGRLTDGQGRTVDFRHCVVIMTSNIGAHRILDHKGDVSDLKDELMGELRTRFLPEFLNRIDDIIVFHGLTEEDLGEIVDHLLGQSERRVHAQGLKLEVTEAAKKLLIAHGHQPEFGARPLRRTIQAELDNRIADLLLGGEADPGDTIVADVRDDSLHCTVRKGSGSEAATP
jgi:ATP-dependent Clp protease ATP-binding subunit ClpC